MFEKYFKLADQPFGATPDPRFLFQTGSHREALASLYTGFYGNRGFTVLIAEPGMGKTTLLFDFLDHIRDRAKTVFLFDTLCGPQDILSLILQDLGLQPGQSVAERHRQLNEFLASQARADRRVVLVIDEAQNLSLESLEAVRLLTNFETSRSKLMQIVLAGQPQLADHLARPEVSQLLQRVSTMCRLTPFSPDETTAYIQHRLKMAGYTGGPVFTSDALRRIAKTSGGTPRIINTLCFNSLCLCRARETRLVDEATVAEAIADLQLPTSEGAAVAQKGKVESAPNVPIPQLPEIQLSMSRSARYLTAALVVLCALSAAAGWQFARTGGHLSLRLPAALHRRVFAAICPAKDALQVRAAQVANQSPQAAPLTSAPSIDSARPDNNSEPTRVIVGPGDTLESIATNHLGNYDEAVLREIRALNPHIEDPNHIEIGRAIRLPALKGSPKANAPMRSEP